MLMGLLRAAMVVLSVCLSGTQCAQSGQQCPDPRPLQTVAQRYVAGTNHGARGDNEVLHHTLLRYFGRQSDAFLERVSEKFSDAMGMGIATSFANAGMFSVEQATRASEADLKNLGFDQMWERKIMAKALRKLNRDFINWRKDPLTALRLITSVKNGEVHRVNELLFHGASPDAVETQAEHLTAVRIAVHSTRRERDGSDISEEDSLEMVQMLVNAGADINLADAHGVTALHAAVAAGRSTMIRRLIQIGARSDVVDANGMTPLQLAQAEQYQSAIDALQPQHATRSAELVPETMTKVLRTPTRLWRLPSRPGQRTRHHAQPPVTAATARAQNADGGNAVKASSRALVHESPKNATLARPESFFAREPLQVQMHELLNRLHATHVDVSYSM